MMSGKPLSGMCHSVKFLPPMFAAQSIPDSMIRTSSIRQNRQFPLCRSCHPSALITQRLRSNPRHLPAHWSNIPVELLHITHDLLIVFPISVGKNPSPVFLVNLIAFLFKPFNLPAPFPVPLGKDRLSCGPESERPLRRFRRFRN